MVEGYSAGDGFSDYQDIQYFHVTRKFTNTAILFYPKQSNQARPLSLLPESHPENSQITNYALSPSFPVHLIFLDLNTLKAVGNFVIFSKLLLRSNIFPALGSRHSVYSLPSGCQTNIHT
jgi:hypothetical protein